MYANMVRQNQPPKDIVNEQQVAVEEKPPKLFIFTSRSLKQDEQEKLELFRKVYHVSKRSCQVALAEHVEQHDILLFDLRVGEVRRYAQANIDFVRQFPHCYVKSFFESNDDLGWTLQLSGKERAEELPIFDSIKQIQARTFIELVNELSAHPDRIPKPVKLFWWVMSKMVKCLPFCR